MRINTDHLLAALAGGFEGGVRGLQMRRARDEEQEERRYRRGRDEIEDKRELARINAQVQGAAMNASAAVAKELRDAERRRRAGGVLRSAVLGNEDVPEAVRQRLTSMSDDDIAELEPAAVARLFLEPYSKPAAAQELEGVRAAGRTAIENIRAAGDAAAEAGRQSRFEEGERGRQSRFEEQERRIRELTALLEAGRDRRSPPNKGSSFDDLLEHYGAEGNRSAGAGPPARLPAVTVTPKAPAGTPNGPRRARPTPQEEQDRDLDEAVAALRARHVPRAEWPAPIRQALDARNRIRD